MTTSLAERFAAKVDTNGPVPAHAPELGPCHVWTASLNAHGYGQMGLRADETESGDKRPILAHRVAFYLADGRWPRPAAVQVCRNRACVRREHLLEGKARDATPRARTLPCRTCGGNERDADGYCLRCRRSRDRRRNASEERRLQKRAARYRFSVLNQRALFAAQDGRCGNPACRVPLAIATAHLDHDHACCAIPARSCGRCIRGFLCKGCSVALGEVADDVERLRGLTDYLGRGLYSPSK